MFSFCSTRKYPDGIRSKNFKWSKISDLLSGRLGKQCRERYYNHLDPTLIKSPWTKKEDLLLLQLQSKMGNKWSEIAKTMVGRSENNIKNRFNSAKKRKNTSSSSSSSSSNNNNNNQKFKKRRVTATASFSTPLDLLKLEHMKQIEKSSSNGKKRKASTNTSVNRLNNTINSSPMTHGNRTSSDQKYEVGDKVDCRFLPGNCIFYSGTIIGINQNGTYQIKYDDGDEDLNVSDTIDNGKYQRIKFQQPKKKKQKKSIQVVQKLNEVQQLRRKRSTSCKTCTNCVKADCGTCKYCLDKPKFGGLGKMKQKCIQRRCLNKGLV